MKLKLDENGNVVLQDGKPVYVHDDGKEVAFDAPGTVATISRLNAEAKSHRERAEAAEGSLKGFEGIDDPKAALKALSVVANLDQKKLVDAGEMEKVTAEIKKALQTQLDEAKAEAEKYKGELYQEKVGGSFSRSKFIAEKLGIPVDIAQSHFGRHFKVEDGKTVAYDSNGTKIYSRERPGEIATFDEALESLVEQYPHRDSILKGSANPGMKTNPKDVQGGKNVMSRSQFDALSPAEKSKAATDPNITISD